MNTAAFARTELLLGEQAVERLATAHVAIFGLGGVGSFAAEGLVRSAVGRLTLVDHDVVGETNLNRQAMALRSTIGQSKVVALRHRLLDINPEAVVNLREVFYRPELAQEFDFADFDYVIDAIDTVRAKVDLAVQAQRHGVRLISCMGMGNRIDPTQVRLGDLSQTDTCPLCRAMRKKLRRQGIESLPVVYSLETPLPVPKIRFEDERCSAKRPTPGSIVFVPATAGMALASAVVRGLLGLSPAGHLGGKAERAES